MRRIVLAVVLLSLVAAPATAQSRDRIARTFSESFERGDHQAVMFELNVGSIKVSGAETDTITAEIRVRCSRKRDLADCKERAEDVKLTSSERRGRLYLEIEGASLWASRHTTVEVILTVPRELATELEIGTGETKVENLNGDLSLEMSVGEATLTNLGGNVVVDMGIGEVSLTMPQDLVGEVTLDNGVGETSLRHRDGHNSMEGILGGTDVHWDNGTGPHSIKIDLNVGEIDVRLR